MLLLTSCGGSATNSSPGTTFLPSLASCSGSDMLFSRNILTLSRAYMTDSDGHVNPVGKLLAWQQLYDWNVNSIIEAHSDASAPIRCTELAAEPASGPLEGIAAMLPAWSGAHPHSLSEDDMAAVLLEHLRVYECRLKEQIALDWQEQDRQDLASIGIAGAASLETQALMKSEQTRWVNEELKEAPLALGRTLRILEGENRLRPLDHSLECLARTSLDIRNALGLAAETSACLPRIWDARGSLRDLSTPLPTTPAP